MHRVLVDMFIASHKAAPKEVVLDFDVTDDPVHGEPVGSSSTGATVGAAFCRFTSSSVPHLVVAYQRTDDRDQARHAAAILKLLVAPSRELWLKVRIVMRVDPGFCRQHLLGWCEHNGAMVSRGVV